MQRYPMIVFYQDGSTERVENADDELALRPGWEDTPAAFAPGYVRPVPGQFVPTANPAMLASLTALEQARMREMEPQAVRVDDTKVQQFEQQIERLQLDLIGLQSRLGLLEGQVFERIDRLVQDLRSHAEPPVPMDTNSDPEPVGVAPVPKRGRPRNS